MVSNQTCCRALHDCVLVVTRTVDLNFFLIKCIICVFKVFVASVGTRNDRIQQALESVLSPVVDGALSTMLGVIMLAGSEFDFVVK